MQLERAVRGRLLGVDDHVERLVVDVDQRECVLGRVAGLGHDRGDARARERDAVDLERPRRVDEVLDAARLPCARQRRQLLEVLAGEDGDDARGLRGLRRVDALDPRVREGRAQDRDVRHPGQLEVVEVLRRAGDQARVLDALDGLADEPGGCLDGRHAVTSTTFAASWTAWTMFS